MFRLRLASLLALFCLLLPAFQPAASADGVIIDPPPPCSFEGPCPPVDPRPLFPLAVQYHHVSVNIDQQVAVTHVDELFRNDNNDAVSAPTCSRCRGALVTDFAMWVDGTRRGRSQRPRSAPGL
jgi:Ca-activated chloride channel family protein